MDKKKIKLIKKDARKALFKIGVLLNFFAERGNTVLPFIVLVVGAVIITHLPPSTSRELFKSPAERESVLSKFGGTDPKTPIIIIAPDCEACSNLIASLDGAQISYVTTASNDGATGSALVALAGKRGEDSSMPMVLIGTSIVRADLSAVKSVLASQ